jgi:hypothetical protein
MPEHERQAAHSTEPTEAQRKVLADNKEARAKSDEQREAMAKGTPTPTQEENDMAAVGAHVLDKQDDGSGPDRAIEENKKKQEAAKAEREKQRGGAQHETRQSEADKPSTGGYQTRQATPRPQQR